MEMKVNSSRPLRTMACLPVRIQSWEKGFWGSLAERLRFPNAGTSLHPPTGRGAAASAVAFLGWRL